VITVDELKAWAKEAARGTGVSEATAVPLLLRGLFHGVCLADRHQTDGAKLALGTAALKALEDTQR
jgi:hypothetical protein